MLALLVYARSPYEYVRGMKQILYARISEIVMKNGSEVETLVLIKGMDSNTD